MLQKFYYCENQRINDELTELSKPGKVSTTKLAKICTEELSREKNIRKAILIERIRRSLHKDALWKELKGDNHEQARRLAKKIAKKKFIETHMHYGPSSDSWVHWRFLRKTWKYAKRYYREAIRKGKTDQTIYDRLKRILSDERRGMDKIKCAIRFDQLLLMEKHGSFHSFDSKAWISNVIELAAQDAGVLREYLHAQLCSIAQYANHHGITACDIRFPAIDSYGLPNTHPLELHAQIAKEVEDEYHVRIRYIHFPMRNHEKTLKYYEKATSWSKKYLIGFDFKGDISIANQLPKPIMVHAGELMTSADIKKRHPKVNSKQKVVEHLLNEVEKVLQYKKLARIGHGSILGLDVSQYGEVLVKKQTKLLEKVAKRKISIEVNPSSNTMIGGYPLHKHPAKKILQHGIKICVSTDDRTNFDTNIRKEYFELYLAIGASFFK